MSKDAKDQASPTKIEDKKAEQPWSDKERSIIVNHVLTHVLTTLGYGSAFSELPEILAKEGCPARPSRAVSRILRHSAEETIAGIDY